MAEERTRWVTRRKRQEVKREHRTQERHWKPQGRSVNSELETVRFLAVRGGSQQGPLVKLQTYRAVKVQNPNPLFFRSHLAFKKRWSHSASREAGSGLQRKTLWVNRTQTNVKMGEAAQCRTHGWGSRGAAIIKIYKSAAKRRKNLQVSNLPGWPWQFEEQTMTGFFGYKNWSLPSSRDCWVLKWLWKKTKPLK